MSYPKNVLGGQLELCCNNPVTGYFRNGFCDTCDEDLGVHSVCTVVTREFLEFSRSVGNDLITPIPEYGFPGLINGVSALPGGGKLMKPDSQPQYC